MPATQDFCEGLVGHCFVASAVYSQMLSGKPKPCGNFFNLAGLFFALASLRPNTADQSSVVGGNIALQRAAKINLEMALLADGVKPEDIYAVLSTETGVKRAFTSWIEHHQAQHCLVERRGRAHHAAARSGWCEAVATALTANDAGRCQCAFP